MSVAKQKDKEDLIVKFKVQSWLVVERERYYFQDMMKEKGVRLWKCRYWEMN